MRHRNKINKLNRTSSHRKAMMSNMINAFFDSGKIKTTHAKAKLTQQLAEKMITRGKRGGLHAHRVLLASLHDKKIVKKIFDSIVPICKDRNGGYTRITKLGFRKGDGAALAMLEFVDAGVESGTKSKKEIKQTKTAKVEAATEKK